MIDKPDRPEDQGDMSEATEFEDGGYIEPPEDE